MEYIKRFLLVGGRSGSGISSVYGTPLPIRTTNLDNSHLTRLLSSVPRFRGYRRGPPFQARNQAKTIAMDKPVSTLIVLANIKYTYMNWQGLICTCNDTTIFSQS
ncbi:hypothetical protein D1007_22400 [Hordeum vulgare]|nr:hypothetical protein D1007_22400 [Hordeum vulgare]